MKRVLSARDEETLQPVLLFLVGHITDPRYCSVLCDVAHILAGGHYGGSVIEVSLCNSVFFLTSRKAFDHTRWFVLIN